MTRLLPEIQSLVCEIFFRFSAKVYIWDFRRFSYALQDVILSAIIRVKKV
jgi:hypothetical protein